MKIMASDPITSWEIDGETVETVSDFIFWGSKITADGDCSHVIKRRLLLGRKVMTNLDSILKSRDITLQLLNWSSYYMLSNYSNCAIQILKHPFEKYYPHFIDANSESTERVRSKLKETTL